IPSTTDTFTLSLHDALPILMRLSHRRGGVLGPVSASRPPRRNAMIGSTSAATSSGCFGFLALPRSLKTLNAAMREAATTFGRRRSEEHTSELQLPCNLVCRL